MKNAPSVLKQKDAGRNVFEMAEERMAEVFRRFDAVYVASSGGKDSTMITEMALREARRQGRLPLRVVHLDEEVVPPGTIAYLERLRKREEIDLRWYCLQLEHRNACSRSSPYWYPWDEECPDRWVREFPSWGLGAESVNDYYVPRKMHSSDVNHIYTDPAREGQTAILIGLRAAESQARRFSVLRRVQDNYIVPYHSSRYDGGTEDTVHRGLYSVYPCYDWRVRDVWLAIKKFGWDFSEDYLSMRAAGLSAHHQRVAPPFGEEPSVALWRFRVCWPDLWEKVIRRVPGAMTAARYANTQLFGMSGSLPPRRQGEHYREYILRHIQRYPPDVRKRVGQYLKSHVRFHFQQTNDPILDEVPHPLSGVSWRWLATRALRGSFKARSSTSRVVRATDRAAWDRYKKAREEEGK